MDIEITNKINLFDLEKFVKKIWKRKRYHNTNMNYYNYLINQNFSENKSNILVSYYNKKLVYFICNINLLYSNYKVGSLINFYTLDKNKYNFIGAQLLRTYLNNYDIVFNSAPREQFKNSLLKNKNWHNTYNYLCKINSVKNSDYKYADNKIDINFIKITSEHINFINSIKDYQFFDKSINYYNWRIDQLNLFYDKSIHFVEIRINKELKSLFLIELKNKNLYIYEYYSNLNDLEKSLYYLLHFLNNKKYTKEVFMYFHEIILNLLKHTDFEIINKKYHFFYFRNNIKNIKKLDLNNFFVFPTDSDEFFYS